MVLQIQAEGQQWCEMESFLNNATLKVIIDHFGRTPVNDASGGFEGLMRASKNENLWFKFSAPYRMNEKDADECARIILETIGFKRILWGSDFPNTQFEGQYRYADTLNWLKQWVKNTSEHDNILNLNPLACFWSVDINH
jgi:predicted TIM-barrel fold metal-dependent hydrolase